MNEPEEMLELFCEAACDDLGQLILLHDREPDAKLLDLLKSADYPESLNLKLESERAIDALELTAHVMNTLEVNDALLDELAADYASVYLNHVIRASPMESVWIDDEGLTHQEPMFQVRDYLRRHGLQAEDWRKRSDDHLVIQLRFIQHLLSEGELETAANFMDEHLLRWLGHFCERVATRCATSWFASAAILTHAWCEDLRDLLAEILGMARPTAEEIEKRMSPKPAVTEIPLQYMPGAGPAV